MLCPLTTLQPISTIPIRLQLTYTLVTLLILWDLMLESVVVVVSPLKFCAELFLQHTVNLVGALNGYIMYYLNYLRKWGATVTVHQSFNKLRSHTKLISLEILWSNNFKELSLALILLIKSLRAPVKTAVEFVVQI